MLDALHLSHLLVQHRLQAGGIAVDATAGHGHDTLFLALQLGPRGRVHGFDIQAEALASARRRIDPGDERLAEVRFHGCGHELAGAVLAQQRISMIDAAMFNLGYLPGGNKELTTQPATTVAALSELSRLLVPGGIISVVAYVGHPGGLHERDAVLEWARSLHPQQWAAWRYTCLNRGADRAELFVVERLPVRAQGPLSGETPETPNASARWREGVRQS